MKCGLLGKNLPYSYSKRIYQLFGLNDYSLYEIADDDLEDVISKKDFAFYNVTIPFKKDVIPFLDVKDCIIDKTNVCNLIINDEGHLFGYNTDYLALSYIFENSNYSFKDKNVLILGTGASSNTVSFLLHQLGVESIKKVSREINSIDTIKYSELDNYYNDNDIIINTTPVGTYPNNYDTLINLDNFKKVSFVMDLTYNPLNTRLILDAKKRNIKSYNGLLMLVLQAYYTLVTINDTKVTLDDAFKVYKQLFKESLNTVLIGMPSCGKTKIGKLVSFKKDLEFIDTDNLFYHVYNTFAGKYIETYGEEDFRIKEHHLITEISKMHNAVISTGGGIILNEDNIKLLKSNGIIIFLDRPLDELTIKEHNPLSDSQEKLNKMFIERYPLYKKYADYIVNASDIEYSINKIMEIYDEYINTKWTEH